MNLTLEDAQSAGIGQHQRGRIFSDDPLQLRDIDHAQRIGAQILHLVAADRRRGRVGPVSGIGDDDLAARISLGLMVSCLLYTSRCV